MRRKFSPKFVEHLIAPSAKRLEVWDTVLQCFGVRVSPTGRKVWFVVVRVQGRQQRLTIGTYPAISLAEARDQARKIIRDAQLGLVKVSHEVTSSTLGETVPLFVQLYAKPKNKGWREAEQLLGKFQSIFAKPLTQIVRSDVVRILDEIIASGTPYRANRALAALKKRMNWALDRGLIDVNPIAGLKQPHKERSQFQPRTPARQYLPGETHLYLGRQYKLKVVPDIQQRVKLYRGALVVQSLKPRRTDITKSLVEDWYYGRAHIKFRERLAECQKRFSNPDDYEPNELVVQQLARRWGSMTPGGRLILNRTLIRSSVDAIDYVITHELCHMRHNHHAPEFFRLLERVMPDWEKRKIKLERQLV